MTTPSQDEAIALQKQAIEDLSATPSHLTQMGSALVASLCFDALRIAGSSQHVRLEVEGFKISRTPWDATRLANAIWVWDPGNFTVVELVARIDREAEACAGMPLPNHRRTT